MKCGGMAKFLSDYLDHELDPKFCRDIDRHQKTCQPCRRFILSLKTTIQTLHREPKARLTNKVRANLRKKLLRIQSH